MCPAPTGTLCLRLLQGPTTLLSFVSVVSHDVSQLQQYLFQIVSALDALHESRLWHLNVKHSSFVVDSTGTVKVVGFFHADRRRLHPAAAG